MLPPSVDEFAWCTWDAFYSQVEPDGVLRGLRSLRAAGTPARTLILDDGWQAVTPPEAASPEAAAAATADNGGGGEGSGGANAARAAVRSPLLARVAARASAAISAALLGAVSAALQAFYERFVKRASHGTLPVKVWSWLTRGPLKAQLWGYFDSETDFGRQLERFRPNAKFEPEPQPAASSATAAAAAAAGAGAGAAGAGAGAGEEVRSLAALVRRAKAREGVARVYCWHALHGYWRGVSAALGARAGLPVVQATPRPSRHLLTLEPQVTRPGSRAAEARAMVTPSCPGSRCKSPGTPLLQPAPTPSPQPQPRTDHAVTMPSRPLPTTPQVAWDTPALFGVGLVEDDAGAAALYRELHTPPAAAGVDGVKVCSLVITPVRASRLAVTRLQPPCVARAATPRTPAYPACSPVQNSRPPFPLNRWTCSLA